LLIEQRVGLGEILGPVDIEEGIDRSPGVEITSESIADLKAD
jgi:hypothetical protein